MDSLSMKAFVRGWYWKARMFNGCEFIVWTPRNDMKAGEARKQILVVANGSYDAIYSKMDIEAIWRARSV